jgi:hypothetical protein
MFAELKFEFSPKYGTLIANVTTFFIHSYLLADFCCCVSLYQIMNGVFGLRNDIVHHLLTPHFFVWFVELSELIHHHLIPHSFSFSTNMWNGVIPPNLRNEPMMHHFILDRVIHQTTPQKRL